MERPLHELAAIAAHGKKNKTMGVGLVVGIHVVIISGLIAGLSSTQISRGFVEFSAFVVPKKVLIQDVAPPPIKAAPPQQAAAPPIPVIDILVAPPPVRQEKLVEPPPPLPPTPPKEIASTHTTPPYPPLSQRMGESGVTGLNCDIGVDGKPIACSVTKSSGSGRLDEAASSYVKEHYTWQPATRDGKPVSAKVQMNIIWDLKNAG